MSIIDTLIIDRTQADAELARRLGAMGWAAMTDEQRALYLSDQLKGAYKASDLNRVNAAMDYLVGRLKAQGINVPIKRSKIPHKQSGGKRLPEGFTRVEYIESDGTQHIDTGFKPNQDTKTVIDGMWSTKPTGNSVFYGARTSASEKSYYWMYVGVSNAARSGYNASFNYNWDIDPTARRTVTKDKNVTTVDGASHSWTYAEFQCDYNMVLFALNEVGTVKWFARGRIYSCQIFDNGTLVRDYVPCRNLEGEAGLYDMVEAKFYGRAGGNEFVTGNVIEIYDDFTWYDSDIPTPALLVEHMANVATMRSALHAVLPEIPTDMDDGLTIAEANNIELVLVNMEQLINNMLSAWMYCAEIYSGEV